MVVTAAKRIIGRRMELESGILAETIDLLESLGDWTYFFPHGYFRYEHRIVPPFCGDPYHWHSTRQGQWLTTTMMLTDKDDHCQLRDMANVGAKKE